MSKIGDLTVDIVANSAKFAAGVKQATDSVKDIPKTAKEATDRVSSDFSRLQKSISTSFSLIGKSWNALKKLIGAGSLIAGGTAYLFKSIADGIDDLGDFSAQVGIATEKLQEWEYITSTVGFGQKELFSSLQSATESFASLEIGIGKTAMVLKKYGVDINQFKGLDATDAILKLSDATKNLSNQSRIKIFESIGGGLSKLLPMLANGREEFKNLSKEYQDMAMALSGGDINAAGNVSDNLAKLGVTLSNFARLIVVNLSQPVSKLIDKLVRFIKDSGGIRSIAANMSKSILSAAASFADTAAFLLEAISTLVDAVKKISNFVSGTDTPTGKAVKLSGEGQIGVQYQNDGMNAAESLRAGADAIRAFRDSVEVTTTKTANSFDYMNSVVEGSANFLQKSFTSASDVMVKSASDSAKKTMSIMDEYRTLILGESASNGSAELQRIISERRAPAQQLKDKSFDDQVYQIVEMMRQGYQQTSAIQNLQNYTNRMKMGGAEVSDMQAVLKKLGEFSNVSSMNAKQKVNVVLTVDVDEKGNFFAKVADSKEIEDVTTKIIVETAAREARKVAR